MNVGRVIRVVVVDRNVLTYPRTPDRAAAADGGGTRPDCLEAIARLNHAGLAVVLVRGEGVSADEATAVRSHHESYRKLHQQLARAGGHFDGIFFCPHRRDSSCDCCFPGTGLLCEIAQRFAVSPREMLVIAAGPACVAAGRAFGAELVCIEDAPADRSARPDKATSLRFFSNLNAAVATICAEDRP